MLRQNLCLGVVIASATLGITIIGGLLVLQALTLYTTPVIYLLLDRLHRRLGGLSHTFVRRKLTPPPSIQPAE